MIMLARTIYVVDDEPAVLAAAQRILEHEGYRVGVFRTADEAVAVLQKTNGQTEPADLVLLDMMLGSQSTLTGEQMLEWLRGHRPRVETIVMSGQLGGSALLDLVLRGAADFVLKPFSRDSLLRVVQKHMKIASERLEFRRGADLPAERLRREVFVSYAPANRVLGMGVKRLLERADISAWCADLDLPPNSEKPGQIQASALRQSHASLIVVTPEALDCEAFMAEIRAVRDHQQALGDHYFVAALGRGVTPARLPKILRDVEWHEFSNRARLADNLQSLANTIRLFLRNAPV
ncbi:MAG: response regulator [Kiritimatiellae bacterium]|nr:response regulator [Kiritimatiellia bacterium]